MWSWWLVHTRTGQKQMPVFPSGGSWARELNAGPGGSHSFVLSDQGLSKREVRETLKAVSRPHAFTLVQCWDEVPVYAGLITSRPYVYGGQLTLAHEDVRNIFKYRYPFGTGSYYNGTVELTNMSLRSIAGYLLGQSNVGPYDTWSLPLLIPTGWEPGSHSRTYYPYHFPNTFDALLDLQETEGGPDIDFRPVWSGAGHLQWEVRMGTPAAPMLGGDAFEFNLTAEGHGLTDLNVTEDAQKQLTGIFMPGEGQEWDRLLGWAGLGPTADIPARDELISRPSEPDLLVLDRDAHETLAVRRHPTNQYDFSVLASQVSPAELIPGSSVRIYSHDDWWLDDGWHELRVLGVSGGVDEKLDVMVQPKNRSTPVWRPDA